MPEHRKRLLLKRTVFEKIVQALCNKFCSFFVIHVLSFLYQQLSHKSSQTPYTVKHSIPIERVDSACDHDILHAHNFAACLQGL